MSYRLEAKFMDEEWSSSQVHQTLHASFEAAERQVQAEQAFDTLNDIDGFVYRIVGVGEDSDEALMSRLMTKEKLEESRKALGVLENLRAELERLDEEIAELQVSYDSYEEGSESSYYTQRKLERSQDQAWRLRKLFEGTGLDG